MRIADISRIFGVGEITTAAKTATIRNMLQLGALDFEWSLPSRAEQNPLIWMLKVNGFVMDIRDAPREAQEVAVEQGLIPYIPADRHGGGEWTWDGNDEMDPAQGRVWAIVKGDELHGMIFFNGGDDSEFLAKKAAQRPK